MDEIGRGIIRAPLDQSGLDQSAFADPYLLTPPKCNFCDFSIFCGVHR